METVTRVLIADDHEIFRVGLARVIEREGACTIIAQAGDGREAFTLLREVRPDIAILDVSMDIGARGYMMKDNASADLLACLRTVNEGKHYISPTISHLLIQRNEAASALARTIPAVQRLSPAERRILALLAENLTSKEIAQKLFVSVRTIENHCMHVCRKLDIKGHNKLLQFALETKPAF